MKKILESVLAKIIITSVIMSIISGVLVYKVTETKYEDKIAVLNKDINKMKDDMKKLVSEKDKENENNKEEEVAVETIKEKSKENNTNKSTVKTEVKKTSNPNTEIEKIENVLLKANGVAEWFYNMTSSGEIVSLNGTIRNFKEIADNIDNVIKTVDFSVIGGSETKGSLNNISNMLRNFENASDFTAYSEEILGYIGEFLYQLEYYAQ